MKPFKPIAEEKSRKIFLVFFVLSSMLPLLIVIFICNQYLQPFIEADKSGLLGETLAYGLLVMLFFPLLSFFLMFRRIRSLEGLTREIRAKSAEVIEGKKSFGEQQIEAGEIYRIETVGAAADTGDENEVQSLIQSFNNIFQTAADQLAEREQLKELLASLIALASDLTAELESSRLFPLIISRVTQVMAVERTSLYVIDWDKHELWTKVAEGIDPITLPIGKGISGRVAETGEVINVADAWELPYFDRSFDLINNFRTRSVLSLPVKSPTGEMIGVLQVINKKNGASFDLKDEVFMKSLASQVGIALENSFLIDEARLSFNSSIGTLSATVDARHPLTAGHSLRVTEYSLLIARELNLDRNDIEVLRLAAMLHDIGKIGIRDAVLLKDGVFTPEEREEMNSHPVKTKTILDKFHFPRHLRSVPEIAWRHHEKVNGHGYPDGLTGDQIAPGSKIIAVADVFDALTSRREYPKYDGSKTMDCGAMPLMQAISIIQKEAGSHFAPEVVSAFLRCLPQGLRLYRGSHFAPEYVDEAIRRLAPEYLQDAGVMTPSGNALAGAPERKR
ncbi:MAG: HD domain-containing protein [Proteobacteria bacterium]|nr:HD domain-containing protein [Pseudomonadota bacterium]MBU2228550.1 HD domain-containing protein [Pseudomonadota bacterium]MBU2261036.1 HD domain-containing protein [Pseudomonadota bacterium]